MSKPSTSTIKPKPEISKGLEEWISGANQNVETASPVQAVQPASQPAGQQIVEPASLQAEAATVMLSTRIPKSLHHRLRVHIVTQETQIQDVVVRLLTDYLDKAEGKSGAELL